jgi:hypothetical protein
MSHILNIPFPLTGDRGSTVVKVLRYKSEGRWFDLEQWAIKTHLRALYNVDFYPSSMYLS